MIRARHPHPASTRTPLLAAFAFLAATAGTCGALVQPSSASAADAPATNMTTVGGPVSGKETALNRIQRMVARLNHESATPEGEERVVARLAGQFRTSPDTLRAQRASWGLGYGEVAMVYGFARASRKPGVSPEQVVTMRRDGKAWEAIAKELGVKVDAVASRMKRQVGPKGTSKPK
ncbi:MAG TPA: hypothetical protein VI198_07955 [Candidatus Eisenbacteria bacterium]